MGVLSATINREIPIPLYYQLKEIILSEITNGSLVPGDYLPTENELMARYQISRATVRQAMTELVNENYLSRQKGKGTFVSKPKISQQYIDKVETYREQIKKMGAQPSTKMLSFEVIGANALIAKALNITKETEVIKLIRIRFVEEEPIVIAETYMPYSLCKFVLDYDMSSQSLYDLLSSDDKTKIVKAKRTIEAELADEEVSRYLEIKNGAPLQVIKTTAFNREEVTIEYTIAKYRGDRNLFVIETKVGI